MTAQTRTAQLAPAEPAPAEPASRTRLPLTILILTLDEERDLPACLASVAGLGERIVVLDSGSRDATTIIAREVTPWVYERAFTGYASQRNAALQYAETDWVLFLDADERLTAAGRAEVEAALARTATEDCPPAGYWIPRRNLFFGRALRGGGWWPDEQLRVFQRRRARYDPAREVHEVVILDGPAGRLREPMLHRNYDSWREFRQKQRHYARRHAEDLFAHGVGPRPRTYLTMPLRAWRRRYLSLAGYRDGVLGLRLATWLAWYELVAYVDLGRRWRRERPATAPRARTRSRRLPSPRVPAGHELVQAPPTIDLSIILVSHNSRDVLQRCLRSLPSALEGTASSYECIVVDHASSDGTAAAVRAHFPAARVIECHDNPGFGAGINRGLAVARGRELLWLNPDTELAPGSIARLSAALQADDTIGVVGPRLQYPSGEIQQSRRRFPTRLTPFFESPLVQRWWPRSPTLARYYVADKAATVPQDVDWLYGACLLARREVVAAIGGMDESYFLYSEELDWCHRAARHGWRVRYVPGALVTHHERQSSAATPARRDIAYYSSKVLYHSRAHGPYYAELLRVFMLCTVAVLLAEEGLKWLLGHKRPLRRARMRSHWSVMRSLLCPPR